MDYYKFFMLKLLIGNLWNWM